jgi:biopolymer transport protein ExbD
MADDQVIQQQEEPKHKKRERSAGGETQQPPMTPMIDVTFQLLLFFLLTMTFRMDEGLIPGALPEGGITSATPEEVLHEPIKVFLQPYGTNGAAVVYSVEGSAEQFLNGRQLYDALRGRLNALGNDTEIPVLITPDGAVRWGHIVDVFNQASRLMFENVSFSPAT